MFDKGTDWHFPEPDELALVPAGQELVRASSFGEGVAVLLEALAADKFDAADLRLTVGITNTGPKATILCEFGKSILKIWYVARNGSEEIPAFEVTRKLDTSLLRKLADIIRPA